MLSKTELTGLEMWRTKRDAYAAGMQRESRNFLRWTLALSAGLAIFDGIMAAVIVHFLL